MFYPCKFKMTEIEFPDGIYLVRWSVWSRVSNKLNKFCDVKRHRIFIESGKDSPVIKGERGSFIGHGRNRRYKYSTYGIHVGIDWLYQKFSFLEKDIERCKIVRALYDVVPNINSLSYEECLKYKKMIVFA